MKRDKQLDILTAEIGLNTIKKSFELSIERIKQTHPHRVELIGEMNKHLILLYDAIEVFYMLNEDNKKTVSMVYDLALENTRLKEENNELKKFV